MVLLIPDVDRFRLNNFGASIVLQRSRDEVKRPALPTGGGGDGDAIKLWSLSLQLLKCELSASRCTWWLLFDRAIGSSTTSVSRL